MRISRSRRTRNSPLHETLPFRAREQERNANYTNCSDIDSAVNSAELEIRDEAESDRHTLSLSGQLDIATAGELEATIASLCNDGAREILLDLHRLSFVDSTGLRVILTVRELCETHACDFALTRVQVPVQRLFEHTGLGDRLVFRGRALARRISKRRVPPRNELSREEERTAARPEIERDPTSVEPAPEAGPGGGRRGDGGGAGGPGGGPGGGPAGSAGL
jgi:anti-sigma B factor antagonist